MNTTSLWILEEWSRGLQLAVEAMTGAEVASRIVDGDAGPGPEAGLHWEQPLQLDGGIRLIAAASAESWRTLGGAILQSAGLPDAGDADLRGSYLEVLQQAFSSLARGMAGRLGREVACDTGREIEPTPGFGPWLAIDVSAGSGAPLRLFLWIPQSLVDLLTPAPRESALAQPGGSSAGTRKTMDLLLEVEMPVSVSFGRAHMRLKDVIKLNTGSIVELNRAINEPVEVIVNNCVIARGEVVVVEGNYGVRIRQIVSRQERLRTLY